jgi:hypothetical protein
MKCPICEEELNKEPKELAPGGIVRFFCANCNTFDASDVANLLATGLGQDPIKRAVLSHTLRKMQASSPPFLDNILFQKIIEKPLPTAAEQCENLILWLGGNLRFVGDRVLITPQTHRAVLGAVNRSAFGQVITHLAKQGLIELIDMAKNGLFETNTTLSVDGWVYHEKLRRNNPQSRIAFMAMQFDNQDLDRLVKDVFKPAVAKTGFDLRRLDEKPRAGLIDDRLRVEIRNARFLIADLTDDNEGAYWEAGFAEGLGKPVIFSCEKAKFEEKKTHFDTNHHLTVKWDKNSPQDAAEELKATIRATLPDEAQMTDD